MEKDTFNSLHLALVDQHFSGVSFFRGEPGLVVGLSRPFQIQVTSISPMKSKILDSNSPAQADDGLQATSSG